MAVSLTGVCERLWPGCTSVNSYSAERALEFLQVCSVSVLVCGREKIEEGDDMEEQIRLSARLNRLMHADKDQLLHRIAHASLGRKIENKVKKK